MATDLRTEIFLPEDLTELIVIQVNKFIRQYHRAPQVKLTSSDQAVVLAQHPRRGLMGVLLAQLTYLKTTSMVKPATPIATSSADPTAPVSLFAAFVPPPTATPLASTKPSYCINLICVHPEFRGHNVGQRLIREGLIRFDTLSYNLSTDLASLPSFHVQAWLKPLDHAKLVHSGFMASSVRPVSVKHMTESPPPAIYTVSRITSTTSLSTLRHELSSAELTYFPEEAQWSRDIQQHMFYHMYRLGDLIGFAMLSFNPVNVSKDGSVVILAQLSFVKFLSSVGPDQRLHAIKALAIKATAAGAVALSGYIIGDMDEVLVSRFDGVIVTVPRCLHIHGDITPVNPTRAFPILF